MRVLLPALILLACDGGGGAAPDSDASSADGAVPDGIPPADAAPDGAVADLGPIGGDRAALVYAPAGDPPDTGWPVLVLLHGFRADQTLIDRNFPFSRRVDDDGVLLVIPVGTPNEDGFLRWAADFHVGDGEPGPDVPYLLDVVTGAVARHRGDPSRVFVMGHSNGGAMAVHLACHAALRVAGFINVSGFNPAADACAPARPVSAYFIHGTDDSQVPYAGRDERLGADDAADWWAARAGCSDPVDDAPADLEVTAAGDETTIRRWTCPDGLRVERWRLGGTDHILVPNPAFLDAVLTSIGAR